MIDQVQSKATDELPISTKSMLTNLSVMYLVVIFDVSFVTIVDQLYRCLTDWNSAMMIAQRAM